jgi:Fe2+ or Zn2+ uptake regulation protein
MKITQSNLKKNKSASVSSLGSSSIQAVKLSGCRQTRTRREILAILAKVHPLAAREVKERLAHHKILVNKTTVYRELDFLRTKKIISEVIFQDGIKRYELAPEEHGHHVICLACHKVERVSLANDLAAQEKKISRRLNFKILKHSLEFYGLCSECRDK